MALPLLTFPFGLLGSLSVLLMPEITQADIRGETDRLRPSLTGCCGSPDIFSRWQG